MGAGRTSAIAAAVILVLVIAFVSLSGSKKQMGAISLRYAEWSPTDSNPSLTSEVLQLREKVKRMERLLERKKLEEAAPPRDRIVEQLAPQSGGTPAARPQQQQQQQQPQAKLSATPATTSSAPSPVVALARAANASAATAPRFLAKRKAIPPKRGEVPRASYWTDEEVQVTGGRWCRMPPPYASPKPALPTLEAGTDLPHLTTELAKKHASDDNLLIATYVNYNRLDFAYTLVKQLIALGNPHFIVGALDEKALRGLQEHGIPSFVISSGLTTNDYGWGTPAFRKLGLHKVQLVLDLAKTGVNCLTVDADAFILRDPFPYIRALPNAEVLSSSDHLVATNGYDDPGLEGMSGFFSAFNIGFIFIRSSAIEFVQAWRDRCWARQNDWDQVLFSQVLSQGAGGRGMLSRDRLRKMYKKTDGTHVMAGVLPVALFASGHTFFVSRMAHLSHAHPYMVHTTFQYGGAQGKRHRLREAMMWEDEPSYYSDANFLTYTPDLPYDLVYPNGGKVGADGTLPFPKRTTVEQHFALVNHQLTQIRNAFALASALDRVLILPTLVCGLDRWWAPHSGIIPGSAARLPLLECPADHVIDLERMGKPEKVLREATMLCNPRTPASTLNSVATLNATISISVSADGSNARAARAEGRELVSKLQSIDAKVLALATLPPDYRAVMRGREVDRFERTVASYGGLWCCNRPPGGRGPGHIWYDFLWDVVPHRDRHNRKWDGKWEPKMGP